MLLVLVVGIPAAVLAFKAFQTAEAARLASGTRIEDLQQAITLDPGNAAYYHKLGLVYAYSLNHADLPVAVRFLRKAAELNPREAVYWADLDQVCDMLNDTSCSDTAVKQTLILSPMTPRLEWLAGNHYIQTGHTGKALEHFRRLLFLDDTYAQPVFRICLRLVGNPQTVYQKVLPSGASPQMKLAYLDFLSAHGDLGLANRIWSETVSGGTAFQFPEVRPYLDRLISANAIRQATNVWHVLEQAGIIPSSSAKNIVYNGGFEHVPLNAGFGWRAPNTPYVETDFSDPSAYQGSRCLRVDYAAGQNLESEPVYELIPAEPDQVYQLRAYVRSDDITSQSGPRLRVVDPQCPACLNVFTQTTVGSTPWHPLTLDFTTGPGTRVIRISVWRLRSRTFPMEISGSFWLDDVSIEAMNSKGKETVSGR